MCLSYDPEDKLLVQTPLHIAVKEERLFTRDTILAPNECFPRYASSLESSNECFSRDTVIHEGSKRVMGRICQYVDTTIETEHWHWTSVSVNKFRIEIEGVLDT